MTETFVIVLVIGWGLSTLWAHAAAVGGWRAFLGRPRDYQIGWRRAWLPIAYAALFVAALAGLPMVAGETGVTRLIRAGLWAAATFAFTVAFVAVRIWTARARQKADVGARR